MQLVIYNYQHAHQMELLVLLEQVVQHMLIKQHVKLQLVLMELVSGIQLLQHQLVE